MASSAGLAVLCASWNPIIKTVRARLQRSVEGEIQPLPVELDRMDG
jgi:hypothetical protein